MKPTIRTLRIETDIPGVTRVINHYEAQPVTVDDVRSWCEDYSPPEYYTLRGRRRRKRRNHRVRSHDP